MRLQILIMLLLSLIFMKMGLFSQVDFKKHIVIDETYAAMDARSIFACDINNDGFIDVLSASSEDNKIAWYKNKGDGSFGRQIHISTMAMSARAVYAADLDGDGDLDVLSASAQDNKIAWYENTNGYGSFGPQKIISTSALWATSIYAADIDGDGDVDVLSASAWDNKIAWYDNINGSGTFSMPQIISINAMGARAVFSADIDNDGDLDVLSASRDDINPTGIDCEFMMRMLFQDD